MRPLPHDLYADGRHFDLLFPGNRDMQAFYPRQIARYGGPVLELACGTGRLTIPLALAGAAIVGLDCSMGMLHTAREKARRAGLDLPLVQGDARNFAFARQFRFIFFPANSLCHLLCRDDVEACFDCVRRHLAEDGRFLIDVFVPAIEMLVRDGKQREPVAQYSDPDGQSSILVTQTNRYDPATQINHITWFFQREGDDSETTVPLDLRMFYPQEMDALLEYNGFAIEHKYGDFEERPFGSGSGKQLLVCRRKA